MSKVKEVESFDMSGWHYYDYTVECGFAACICGFQAATKKSEFFSNDNNDNFDYQAGNIAENLVSSCGDLMGKEELDHPHLTKNKPTPADAISFMELVSTKLDDIK